jgi:hypothetical protein
MSRFINKQKTCVLIDGPYSKLLQDIIESYAPAKVTKVSLVHAALDLLRDRLIKEGVLTDCPSHRSAPKVKPTK